MDGWIKNRDTVLSGYMKVVTMRKWFSSSWDFLWRLENTFQVRQRHQLDWSGFGEWVEKPSRLD